MRGITILCLSLLLPLANGFANNDLPESLSSVSTEYEKRLEAATGELTRARETIIKERGPLASEIRQFEEDVLGLKTRIAQLKTQQASMDTQLGNLNAQSDSLGGNLDYAVSLARELTANLDTTLLPGESEEQGDLLKRIRQELDNADPALRHGSTAEAFDLALARIREHLGGSISEGLAVQADNNEVREGQFLYLGPVAYFRDNQSGAAGVAYRSESSPIPVIHPLTSWAPDIAQEVFSGKPGYILADATGGKAVRLSEARGSPLDHVKKGGLVAYVIIGLGILGLLTALSKLWDLKGLSVDSPVRIRSHIEKMNTDRAQVSKEQFKNLKASCRELFTIAIKHQDKPKDLLEEILYAYVLMQRNVHEKRLPMLRVIAAAAPLLGLLGTVVGMIKTFTLITVLGTGNAAKLSSGISEALITTELGLIVAIPTLIIHGYLSHQTEKRLSLLEQYSIELVNALESTGEEAQKTEAVTR